MAGRFASSWLNENLWEVRREFFRRLYSDREHLICPVCGQNAKVYRRKIHATMARGLIRMYREAERDWVHIPSLMPRRVDVSDIGKLAYWWLIKESTEVRSDGGRAGWWQITQRGEEFVRRRLLLPKYALVYRDEVLGFEGEPTDIVSALGDAFNYTELMENA